MGGNPFGVTKAETPPGVTPKGLPPTAQGRRFGRTLGALAVPCAALILTVSGHSPRPAAAQPGPDPDGPPSELKVVEQVNASIDRGLEDLAGKQRKDGGWHANNAINSLAVLAFMGRGHTPGRGRYPDVLEKGKKFLLANAQDNPKGYLAQFGGGSMYEHGLTTLPLAEMYGMDPDPELE